jgi:hypothetical protein
MAGSWPGVEPVLAEGRLREAVTLREALAAEAPESLPARAELAKALISLGGILARKPSPEAIPVLERADEIATRAALADRANENLGDLRVSVLAQLAEAHLLEKRFRLALGYQTRLIEAIGRIAARPEREVPPAYAMAAQEALARIHEGIASDVHATGVERSASLRAALAALRRAREIHRAHSDETDFDGEARELGRGFDGRIAALEARQSGA